MRAALAYMRVCLRVCVLAWLALCPCRFLCVGAGGFVCVSLCACLRVHSSVLSLFACLCVRGKVVCVHVIQSESL